MVPRFGSRKTDTVIFDMDGTVLLSRKVAVESVMLGTREMYKKLCIDARPPDEHMIVASIGKPSPDYFRALMPELDDPTRGRVTQRILELERQLVADGFCEYAPGAPAALLRLRQMGLALGLASNCGQGYFEACTTSMKLGDYFDMMLCSGMRRFPPKAALLREVARSLGAVNPVVVGDTLNDLDASVTCGYPFVGVTFGYGHEAELAPSAVAMIGDLTELVGLIAQGTSARCSPEL